MLLTTILISGASRGLGAALALRFARPGVRLLLLARGAEGLAMTAAACRDRGAEVASAAMDVRDGERLAAQIAAWGGAETVIANAGISRGRTIADEPEGRMAAVEQVAVNLLGVINLVEACLAVGGVRRVAVVGSVAGIAALPDAPGYSASKAGVLAYGEALRAALAPGVRVTVVAPGFFASAMQARFLGPQFGVVPVEVAAERIARAVERGAGRCGFPWGLGWGMRVLGLLPWPVTDWAMRRVRFRIAPEP